eukprot:168406_1
MSSESTDNTNQETQIKDITVNDNQQKHEIIDKQIDNNESKESDNLAVEVDDEEKKLDLNRAPSIMKQSTNIVYRCNTTGTVLNVNEAELKEADEKDEIFEYGFGVPFSYWPEYTHYPYIAANHKSLKDE